ncbi:sodium/calcium exchanger NCL1-like [Hibiscus syriacus]|nr:sodium/calcium exchanger NCL1-like [Hibiscus syriacus]
MIMLLSMIPFLILQLAKILSSARRAIVLISLLTSFALLAGYCTYQVFEPWIQNRRLEYLMRKYIERNLLGTLVSPNGRPDELQIKRLFHKIDKKNNSFISSAELGAFILGIQMEEMGLDEEDFQNKIMQEFDTSGDSNIKGTEFVRGISNWLNKANNDVKLFRARAKVNNNQPWWNYIEAAFLVTLGTTATIMLSKPLVAAFVGFSESANVPSFMVSYVVVPLALHFRQGFRAVSSAREKTEKAASLTFSEVYGAVFMNNVMDYICTRYFMGCVGSGCGSFTCLHDDGSFGHFQNQISVLDMCFGVSVIPPVFAATLCSHQCLGMVLILQRLDKFMNIDLLFFQKWRVLFPSRELQCSMNSP